MKKAGSSGRRPPLIDAIGLQERMLLEAELITRNGEMSNFSAIRDRVAASGKDANEAYREILARRDKVAAKLHKILKSPPVSPRTISPPPGMPLLNAPIAPANFSSGISGIVGGGVGFGYSGLVQAGGLTEGVIVTPSGDTSGGIDTQNLGSPTYAEFGGMPKAGPSELPGNTPIDPTIRYFWLHTWQVLVPFPAPSGLSRLTYSFNTGANFEIFNGGIGRVMSFVSVGETANLTGPVAITTDAGWPLNADLSQPAPFYNGSYGSLSGEVTVQRTFTVGGGHVPAVAVAVGAVVGLPMMAEVQLVFGEFSSLAIYGSPAFSGDYVGGKIAYHVQPELVAK
jgi:hypothetical protein